MKTRSEALLGAGENAERSGAPSEDPGIFKRRSEGILTLESLLDTSPQRSGLHDQPEQFFYDNEGARRIEEKNLITAFAYRQIDEAEVLSYFSGVDVIRRDDWRALESLVFADTIKNARLDFSEFLDTGYHVFIRVRNQGKQYSRVFIEKKVIFIEDDLTDPRTILDVLHEIGHVMSLEKESVDAKRWFDYDNARVMLENEGTETMSRSRPTDEELRAAMKIIIEEERNAWAFALRKIKPFLGGKIFTKQHVLEAIHFDALASYEARIKQILHERIMDQALESFRESMDDSLDERS